MNTPHGTRHLPRWPVALLFLAVLAAILALTWWAYHPGLSGAFLFDDLGSLPKLGATGPVDNWATFWRYITSGSADPTGRPLTLLTFLIDAHNWPANPYPFKVTNVILHLLNGVLLACVLWKLGRVLAQRDTLLPSTAGTTPAVIPGPSPDSATEPGIQPSASEAQSWIPGSARTQRGQPRNDEARLASATSGKVAAALAALFGAGAWLLHPLLVSTTLYVVQREAMLPATFALIGMLGWMASREALARGYTRRALTGMALSAWLCTGLAVLCKANGALVPLLFLLVEWIVLARRPMPSPHANRLHRRAVAVFLVLPGILLLAYLLYLLPWVIRSAHEVRDWTAGQRLLTEPRVLADYLRLLLVPHARSSGLFNDAFPASTGWLRPASTLPCILLVLGLIGAGFALRKKHPAIALALLFYFTAQLMESGWIPLELYFEHRNYLPAMLLFWPIGLGLLRFDGLRWLGGLAAACILLALAGLTWQRATLWGDAPHQAMVWAAINPDSARAQTSAALYDLQSGRPRLAAARLRLAMPKHPDDLQIPVNLITAECRLGAVRPQSLAAARTALANDRRGGTVAFNWFGDALDMAQKHACHGLDDASLRTLLDAAWRNPHWRQHTGLRVNLYHLEGSLALAQQRPQQALQNFDRALALKPRPGTALGQAATLAAAGFPALGLAHLDYFETLHVPRSTGFNMSRIHAWVLDRQDYWPREIAYLRAQIKAATTGHASGSDRP